MIAMLIESDQIFIGHLLARLNQYSLNRPLLYSSVLFQLVDRFQVGGVSSLLRIDRSGRIIGKPTHMNRKRRLTLAHEALWYQSTLTGNMPIFEALLKHLKQTTSPVGLMAGGELLRSIDYQESRANKNALFSKLLKYSNVDNFVYFWLKLRLNFTWVFCLRRKADEGPFSEYQRSFLQQIGYATQGSLKSWYIPAFDILDTSNKPLKDKLTKRQFETLYHLGSYCSRKECARLMSVRNHTIDRNIENLLVVFRGHFKEFQGKTIAQIIRSLKRHDRYIRQFVT